MNFVRIGGAEIFDKAAGAGAFEAHFLDRVSLKVVEKLQYRDRADSGRRVGAFAVRTHISVDHAAVVVGAHGDAAVDVGDDVIAVLIAHAVLLRVGFRDRFLVQHVRVGDAVDALDAREPRVVTVLVDVGRVERVGRLVVLLREGPGDHDAKLGRVLGAADSGDRVVEEFLIDSRESARLRAGASAAADEGVDRVRVDMLFFQHVEDDGAAEVQLLVDVAK